MALSHQFTNTDKKATVEVHDEPINILRKLWFS